MTYNFADHHSIVNQFISELRDVDIQKDRMRFRRNMERIGEIMAYEISKGLSYEEKEVETPMGIAKCTTLIIVDPMLATGASMDVAIRSLQEYGTPDALHICTAISSEYGYNYIRRLYPKSHIWMGAKDEELTAKSYIVPGLGDAGDLCFGPKLQE